MTKKRKKRPHSGDEYHLSKRAKVAAVVKAEPYASAIIIAILIIVAARLLLIQIDRPWVGLHDFNGAFWSIVADNWTRYGVFKTKFAQIIAFGPLSPGQWAAYHHHPWLLPLALMAAFRVFGESETVARAVPLFFSLGAITFLFLLVRRLWGVVAATMTAGALIAIPHFLYLGKMVDHEALVLCFMLGAAYFYIRWRDCDRRLDYFLFISMLVGGGLSDWPAYYFMIAIFMLDVFLERRVRLELLTVPVVFVFLLLLFIGNSILLKGWVASIADFADIFKLRSGQVSGPESFGFTWTGLLERQYYRFKNEFTLSLFVMAGVGAALLVYLRSTTAKLYLGFVAVFLAVAVVHVLVFPHGAWNHNYWNYYFLAPLVLPAAAFGAGVYKKRWQNIAALVVGLILLGGLIYQSSQTTKYAYEAEVDYRLLLLGQTIKANSDFKTLVIVDLEYVGPKAIYYADRNIIWSIYKPKQLEAAVKANPGRKIVFVDAGTAPELAPYLKERYPAKTLKRESLTIYKIQ